MRRDGEVVVIMPPRLRGYAVLADEVGVEQSGFSKSSWMAMRGLGDLVYLCPVDWKSYARGASSAVSF